MLNCRGGGREFESRRPRQLFKALQIWSTSDHGVNQASSTGLKLVFFWMLAQESF